MRRPSLLLLLALLVATPAAAATPVGGWLQSDAPVRVRGGVEVVTEDGFLSLSESVNATGLALRFADARGWLVQRETTGVESGLSSALHMDSRNERTAVAYGAGTLDSFRCRPSCKVLVYPLDGGALHMRGFVDGPLVHAAAPLVHEIGTPGSATAFSRHAPVGALLARGGGSHDDALALRDARVEATGRVALLLWDVTAVLRTQNRTEVVDTYTRTEVRESLVERTALISNRTRYLLLELDGAELDVPAGSPALLAAPQALARLDGSLVSQQATGHVVVDGERHEVASGRVLIEGDLALRPQGVPGRTPLDGGSATVATFAGDATRVYLAGTPIVVLQPGGGSQAAGGAALAALLLAYAAASLRAVALPLYSRIDRSRVLKNENRRMVLATVTAQPGCTIKAIVDATGLSRIVVRHHLRFLEAHAFIRSVPKARGRLYFPPEARPAAADVALAASGESRRRLLDALREAPAGLTQRELAGRVGVSVRLVSYHLRALEQAGLARHEGGFPRRYRASR